MKLEPDQLSASLAKGLRGIYTIHGDEALQAQEAADAIRTAARAAGHSERAVFTASGAHFDWSSVIAASQSMSLFGDKQIVEIRIPSGKPGKEGSAALQRYVDGASDDVVTIVTLPRLDFQQSKSAWFTALDGGGFTIRVDPIERPLLPRWLAQRLAQQQQRVADGDEGERSLAFIADRVEGNLLAAHQELSKLALLHPPGVLRFEQIEAAVLNVARYEVGKLAEAIFAGQVERSLRVLEGLEAEGESTVYVLWTLAEDLRTLERVRSAVDDGKPLPLALRDQRVWGVKERLFERVLPRLAQHQLAHLVERASAVDGIVKGLVRDDWPDAPWQALRRLVLLMLDAVAAPGAAKGKRPAGTSAVRLALRT